MGFMEYGAAYGSPTPRPPIDFEAIRENNPVSAIVGAIVKLHRAGREWKACCPLHADRSPSFTIFAGDRRFHCFGCGASGDVLDLVAQLHNVGMREAADMLGGGEMPTVAMPKILRRDEPDRDTVAEAVAIWAGSLPAVGTVVADYLAARGLCLPIPDTIRLAALRYGKSSLLHPVMLGAVMAANGEVVGVQRTFLRSDGSGKADVPKPKLSLGRISGGAIRMSPPAQHLVLTGGIEDALTIQQETGRPTWAATGERMIANMILPDIVASVAIGADNDPAGIDAAEHAAETFARQGREARVMRPDATFKDFNAQLQGTMS